MSENTVIKNKPTAQNTDPRPKTPCLTVLEGTSVGEIYKIENDAIIIGRDTKCDIPIQEDGVSRQHAKIEKQGFNCFITDLGSTNGTTVNGNPIERTKLADGDKIRLGDILLRFSYQDNIDVSHQESMREMAMRDALTRIYNRRYFMDLLYKEINYSVRIRQPISVIMVDIDYFKKINDSYGHAAGDAVLIAVAQRLSKELRVYDAFARYGGEEFVIMLRTATLENSVLLAERLRKVVENMTVSFEDKTLSVTVSMGISTLDPEHVVSMEDLIKEADTYLYHAKNNGRNRVSSKKDK